MGGLPVFIHHRVLQFECEGDIVMDTHVAVDLGQRSRLGRLPLLGFGCVPALTAKRHAIAGCRGGVFCEFCPVHCYSVPPLVTVGTVFDVPSHLHPSRSYTTLPSTSGSQHQTPYTEADEDCEMSAAWLAHHA